MNSPALDQQMQLLPAGSTPRLLMFALCVLLPVAIALAAALWQFTGLGLAAWQPGRSGWIFVAGTTTLVLLIWFALDRAMCRHRLELAADRLTVKTSFYWHCVPLSDLQLEQARIIDLDERGDFSPRLKTNGYSVHGFQSGHFRLRNGQKAFVAIAGGRRALWLPTAQAQGLLLQPVQPEALLQRLRELAAAGTRR